VGESIDYIATLADMEAKRASLDQAIVALRQAITMGALAQVGEGGGVPSMGTPSFAGGEVPTGAFLGKSIIEAAKLYLEIVKKKQTAKEIMDGLVKGGMETNSRSFLKTVHAALTRARQAPNPPLVKVGMQWGLAGWFPKGISNGSARKKKVKKNTHKPSAPETARVAKPNGKAASAVVSATEKRTKGKLLSPNTQRLTTLVHSKPGLTLHEIAKEAGMDVPLANRLMINVVRSKKVDKRDAKYWPAA
jgi:hypothetical protein